MSLDTMSMHSIPINKLEKFVEFRLRDLSLVRVWRVAVALVTNLIACLLVIAATRAFEIILHGRIDGFSLGGAHLASYVDPVLDALNLLLVLVFTTSAILVVVRTFREPR
jgi:hypothetical protein